ncbi:IS4 family transposase [Salipaludibacillus aurantiacus]|nr:IS4 family transposase [Salipaludibacillus aurantiacus]
MKSIGHKALISQCLDLLPSKVYGCPLVNYGNDKLSAEALMKVFIAANLDNWQSYQHMELMLDANHALKKSLDLETMSGSQISRRINDLPTEWAQDLFLKVVSILQELTQKDHGITKKIGQLSIVDSTHLKLPSELCKWAYVSKEWHVVKMHTRVRVVSEDSCYPDKILPSTGNVSDFESSDELIEDLDTTYLMDRGYPSKQNLRTWLDQNLLFVARITQSLKVETIGEYSVDHPAIISDSKVLFNSSDKPVRLVVFKDDKDCLYRLMTSRWDLTSQEIMDLYRHRWKIETFFKWIKQHLSLVKIWSTKPQGVWNQMFLSLTAYCLALILKLKTGTNKTLWEFLLLMRVYMYDSWDTFTKKLFRKKSKTSRGRQKVPIEKKKDPQFQGSVAKVKVQKRK